MPNLYLTDVTDLAKPAIEKLADHITAEAVRGIPKPSAPPPAPAPTPTPPPASQEVTLLPGSAKVEPENGIALLTVNFQGVIPDNANVQLHVIDADTPETFINADFDPREFKPTVKDGVSTWTRAVTLAGLSGGYRVAAGLFINDASKGWPQYDKLKVASGVQVDTPARRIVSTFTAPTPAPAPSPAPAPTPPATGGPAWHSWFPTAPHARRLDDIPGVIELPNDARTGLVRNLKTAVCNVTQYTIPINYAKATDPLRKVTIVDPSGGRRKEWMLRIPDSVRISPGTDMHCTVIHPDGVFALEVWGARRQGNGDILGYAGVRNSDLRGNGTRHSLSLSTFSEKDPETGGWGGTRAWGGSQIPGLIMPGEIVTAKRIRHALYVGLPKEILSGGAATPPATRPDTAGMVANGWKMGDYMRLPKGLDLTKHFSGAALVVAQAFQDFGGFVGDQSGGWTLNSELIAGQPDGNAINASGQLMKIKSMLVYCQVPWR